MNKLLKSCSVYIAVLLSGAAMVLAFAPLNYYPLAILSPAVLLLFWQQSTARRAACLGLLFGLGFFGCGVSWVYISIHTFGSAPVILALLFTALFVFILSLFIAATGYLLKRWFHDHPNTLLLAFPTLWVLFEWVRSWFLTGFPWLYLGDSQVSSPLAGWAPIFSAFGVSFTCALSAGLLVNAIASWRRCCYSLLGLMVIWGAGYALSFVNWTHPTGQSLQITLVQGNIAQSVKWRPDQVPLTLQTYQQLTEKHWQSDLIIWPEAAVPLAQDGASFFLEPLAEQAKQNNSTIITGIPIADRKQRLFYNGIIAIGQDQGQYLKQHLVPFGEYVPLERLLRGLIKFFDLPMSNFTAGPEQQPPLDVKHVLIAPFTCYEIAYVSLALDILPQANLLLNVSDDSWFGESWATEQQFEISRMRSLESGRYQVVAGNNGITGLIDAKGQVIKRAPMNVTTTLSDRVPAMRGSTPIVWLGLTPIVILLFILLLIAFIYRPESISADKHK